VVIRPVPANSTVVGIPGRIVRGPSHIDLEHGRLPDPEGQLIEDLARRVRELEREVRDMRRERVGRLKSVVGS